MHWTGGLEASMNLLELRSLGVLSLVDVELARNLTRICGAEPEVALAIALTSRNVRRGHTCFALGTDARSLWPGGEAPEGALPEPSEWSALLRASPLTEDGPLVLDERDRLYFRRYWQLEDDIARNLESRAEATRATPGNREWRERALDRLFPGGDRSPQRRAAILALQHRVSLLCGGPGTGKTTTVAAILAALAERELLESGEAPRALLLAPTGKAAARLGEAVRSAKKRIDTRPEVLDSIPSEAATVHRALGMRRSGIGFRRGADFPLDADLIVLDEASMIDLAMMRQLLEATPKNATLLIVGDPDQLSSVEAGSVLRDLVEASEQTWWRGRLTRLTKTWRYDEGLPLGELIKATREGDTAAVASLLAAKDTESLSWSPSDGLATELELAAGRWLEASSTNDPAEHFAHRSRYVLLTPFRRGRIGTHMLGEEIRKLLDASGDRSGVTPIMIEQNDRELGVFNGDPAMLVDGDPRRAFVQRDDGTTLELAESRLPPYSTAFALSVHKSQGSEFDEVLVVLPDEDAPLLTRELLYTALSRAKRRARIVGPKEVIVAALARRARRDSGLVDAIGARAPR
jgi:exodeoxyribonuclease V alpha subunit